MAFIPDDALDRFLTDELPPAAQNGYLFFCRYRNHRNGVAPKTFDDAAEKLGWKRATKFLVQKILTEKGWVSIEADGVRPLVGDFSPAGESKFLDFATESGENQSKKLDSGTENDDLQSKNLDSEGEKEGNQSKKLDSKPEKSKNLDSENAESLKIWTEKSKNLDSPPYNPHKEESLNLNQPLNQPKEDMSAFSEKANDTEFARIEFEEKKPLLERIAGKIGSKPKMRAVSFDEWLRIKAVFEFWRQHFEKNANTRLTDVRGRAVLDRLRAEPPYSVEELCDAIRGCRASPWHNGTDPRSSGMVYDDLELICRTDNAVEKFKGVYEAFRKGNLKTGGETDGNSGKQGSLGNDAHLRPRRIGEKS